MEAGSFVICICGKGGVGKTTVTALMAKALVEENKKIRLLVIDADPVLGAASALGIKDPRSVGEVREEIISGVGSGRGKEIKDNLDYILLSTLIERDDFNFLAMGRTETLGCFCPVNTILKRAITSLSSSFDVVLIDAEAGIEQLHRQVIGGVNLLLIVTDPSQRGFATAGVIKKITEQHPRLRPEEMGLIINRYRDGLDNLKDHASNENLDVWGIIPEDETISNLDLRGSPIYRISKDARSYESVQKILVEVLKRETN